MEAVAVTGYVHTYTVHDGSLESAWSLVDILLVLIEPFSPALTVEAL